MRIHLSTNIPNDQRLERDGQRAGAPAGTFVYLVWFIKMVYMVQNPKNLIFIFCLLQSYNVQKSALIHSFIDSQQDLARRRPNGLEYFFGDLFFTKQKVKVYE